MSKVLKRIACIIGLVLLVAVFIINIVYTAYIAEDEKISFEFNSIPCIIESILIAIILYNVCKIIKLKIDKKKEISIELLARIRKHYRQNKEKIYNTWNSNCSKCGSSNSMDKFQRSTTTL